MKHRLLVALATLTFAACDAADEPAAGGADAATIAEPDTAAGADTETPGADTAAPQADTAAPAEDMATASTPDTGAAPDGASEDAAEPAEDVAQQADAPPPVGHPDDTYFDPYNDPNVQCPPAGETGKVVGTVLPQVKLKTCDGKPFYVSELCGAQAYWIFQTAGWCPYCAQTAKTLEDIPQDYFDSGVWIIVNVLRDQNDKVASTGYCQAYAKLHKIPQDRILVAVDPTQSTKQFNPSGSVPFHVVLDRDLRIRYLWNGGDDSNTALAYIKLVLKDQAKQDAGLTD